MRWLFLSLWETSCIFKSCISRQAQGLFIEEAESIICSESAYLRNCHGRFAIASKPQEHCRHGTFRHQHQEYLRNIRSRSKSNGQRNWKESLTGWKTVGIRSS